MMDLTNCRNISIYLGGACNFACQYCDREEIKSSVGYSVMRPNQVPDILRFFDEISKTDTGRSLPVDVISFFGGEPFVHIAVMEEIINQVSSMFPGMKFFIQTNGSLIMKNQDFITRHAGNLRISISHDMSFQSINRTVYDLGEVLDFLRDVGVDMIQIQHVLPVNRQDAFSIDHYASIVKTFSQHRVDRLSLIPLRHIRGFGRFRTLVNDVPPAEVFQKLIQLVQMLYVQGIPTVVDGMEEKIEKSYFNAHKQLVLSPDGYLYPEFDFIEYKVEGARIGQWQGNITLNRSTSDDHLIWEKCHTCPARNQCGIKYLYGIFGQEPDNTCLAINGMYMAVIRHNLALRQAGNLLNVVGMK